MHCTYRTHRTRVLGLSASMLAGRNSHQTTPGPGATIQKSRDSLAVQSPILAGVCNASNIIPKVLPETGNQTLKIRSKYVRNVKYHIHSLSHSLYLIPFK